MQVFLLLEVLFMVFLLLKYYGGVFSPKLLRLTYAERSTPSAQHI